MVFLFPHYYLPNLWHSLRKKLDSVCECVSTDQREGSRKYTKMTINGEMVLKKQTKSEEKYSHA
jgi:hypothetical protein